MINLIPPTAKKKVIKEYWIRVTSVWLFMASVVGVVIALFLLPVYILVTSQVGIYESSASEATAKVAAYDISASQLTKANFEAQKLIELKQIKQFSDLVTEFNKAQGEDIILNDFQFGRSGMSLDTVRLSGEATTRQALATFRDSLLAHSEVKEVNLPISNLTKDKDIKFVIDVVLDDSKKTYE